MTHVFRFPVFAFILCCAFGARAADILSLSGRIEQGGIVLGATVPGAKVDLDGKDLHVTEDGRFVIGFGRDHAETAVLEMTLPSGRKSIRTLDIAPRQWKEQRINGLAKEKVTPPEETLERIYAENALIAKARARISDIPCFETGFVPPLKGIVTGVFGSRRILNGKPRSPHSGVDIAAKTGTPVRAVAPGVVSLTHQDMFFSGKTVMIDHGLGVSSIYIHLDSIGVEKGEDVEQGRKIGTVGSTGRATGPHLHYGISWGQNKLDPETVMKVGGFGPPPGFTPSSPIPPMLVDREKE